MSVPRRDLQASLLEHLNKVFEKDFLETVDVDTLSRVFRTSRKEIELAFDDYVAERQVELIYGGGGFFRARITPTGKEVLDRSSGQVVNEKTRGSLLQVLAELREKEGVHWTDSDQLARHVRIDTNKTCFNLKIMEAHGLVELKERTGGDPANYLVLLTPKGKSIYDNPPPNVLFLSHAKSDEEIARFLKQELESQVPNIDVFVSSDPEDLPLGDPWIQTILDNLKVAKLVLVLASERGLGRRWVWFEAGAGWNSLGRIVSCCIGKARKGQVPPPFFIYQQINIDDESDLPVLFSLLSSVFGASSRTPDYGEITKELARLELRAEDRWERSRASPQRNSLKQEIEAGLARLDGVLTEVLRLLLLYGQLTDVEVTNKLLAKGTIDTSKAGEFFCGRIAQVTGFIEQVILHSDRERILLGAQGPWRVKQTLRPVLEELLLTVPRGS